MVHQIEFDTLDLMMIEETLREKQFYNDQDKFVKDCILHKIDKVIWGDLPKGEEKTE